MIASATSNGGSTVNVKVVEEHSVQPKSSLGRAQAADVTGCHMRGHGSCHGLIGLDAH